MKMNNQKYKNKPFWIFGVVAISLLIILNFAMTVRVGEYEKELENHNMSFPGKITTSDNCPDSTGGTNNSFLQVKYFYSKFCAWCKKEEPILQRLVENYANLIHIEWYDINKCPEMVDKYKVSGVPTFIFSTYENNTEYSRYGFIYEKDLMKLMCDVTKGC